ncbi:unnamed protein product [Heterobilharzia americana]|nr:unnamed protein product [Heterobilharzia americana]
MLYTSILVLDSKCRQVMRFFKVSFSSASLSYSFIHLKHFISMQYGCGIQLSCIYHSLKIPEDKKIIWRPYIYALVNTLLTHVVVSHLKKFFSWCEFTTTVPTVAYFVRARWKMITKQFVNDLIENGVIQARNNSIVTISCSHLNEITERHILNSNNFHPPTNLLSLNQRLKLQNGLFDVFKRMRVEFPSVYEPSLQSTKSAFTALLAFRSLTYSVGFRRFWIAKLDILDCFNQIVHSKLLEIFSTVFDEISVHIYPRPNIQLLKRELEWVLTESLLSIGGNLYSFVKGIPQGSCISSDLANIYLSCLDRELYATRILWSPHKSLQNSVFETTNHSVSKYSTILRYLDDYLCISTSKKDLLSIMTELQNKLKSYGCAAMKKNPRIIYIIQILLSNGLELKSNPPVFCRFSGQPLSAAKCIRRICKFRLHRSTWRFTFYKIKYNINVKRNVFDFSNLNAKKNDHVFRINAIRLGSKIADIIWISLKTSPEKDKLTQPSVCRRLASKPNVINLGLFFFMNMTYEEMIDLNIILIMNWYRFENYFKSKEIGQLYHNNFEQPCGVNSVVETRSSSRFPLLMTSTSHFSSCILIKLFTPFNFGQFIRNLTIIEVFTLDLVVKNDNLNDVTAKYRQVSGGITSRSRTLAEISEELERVKIEMDEKGSSMTDGSSVLRIKQAIQRLKSEITAMDIRTGVLEHILLRTHLRVREDSQKPLFSKVMEPSNGGGAFVF